MAGLGLGLGIWALSSPVRTEICVSCTGRQILNHWTTREVPGNPLERSYCRRRMCSIIFSWEQSNYFSINNIFFSCLVSSDWEGSAWLHKAGSAFQDWLQLGETVFLLCLMAKALSRLTSALLPRALQESTRKVQEGFSSLGGSRLFFRSCLLSSI